MENNIKPIVKDNLYDAANFTDWIDDKYGEMKCFLAYIDDIDALTRINEIKANFDKNATNQCLELQVSFDKKGIIREVIMLIQDKIGDEWTDPERIGRYFFDGEENVAGHEFLSEKEFTELETLAKQAYAALMNKSDVNDKDSILKKTLYAMYVADWKREHAVTVDMELDNMRNYLIEVENSEGDFYDDYESYLNESGYDGASLMPACFDEFLDAEFTDKEYIKSLIDTDSCDENKKIYKHYLALVEE